MLRDGLLLLRVWAERSHTVSVLQGEDQVGPALCVVVQGDACEWERPRESLREAAEKEA